MDIVQTADMNVRAMRVQAVGERRWLKALRMRRINKDAHGILYNNFLHAHHTTGHFGLLRVRNSTPEPDGKRKVYWLIVPGGIHYAHAAVAWTFGYASHGYSPKQET